MKQAFCIWGLSLFLFVAVGFVAVRDTQILWLVNGQHRLSAEYTPPELVSVRGFLLRPEAAVAFAAMEVAMKRDGVYGLRLQSAYRPYAKQQALYKRKHAASQAQNLVAPPGASEHQLGLAVDVTIDGALNAAFGETAAGEWLQQHAAAFGFVLRYPKEKTAVTGISYEPWHLRYVGVPHALYMHAHRLTLEEYIAHIMEETRLLAPDGTQIAYVNALESLPAGEISSLFPESEAGFVVTRPQVVSITNHLGACFGRNLQIDQTTGSFFAYIVQRFSNSVDRVSGKVA